MSTHRRPLGAVLVLGGSAGLGFAVASLALESGASRVIISSSNPSRLEEAVSALQKAHPGSNERILSHACDLSRPVSELESNLTALLEYATTTNASQSETRPEKSLLSHIVFTAGPIFPVQPLPTFSPSAGDPYEGFNVRYLAALTLAKLAPAYMVPGPEASITLTGGTMVLQPWPGASTAVGIAAAVEGLTRGLAVDMAPVRVNLVAPGTVDTPLVRTRMLAGKEGEEADVALKKLGEGNLLGTVGKAEDVAEAYLYFMRDRFQTGTVLRTNGGSLLK